MKLAVGLLLAFLIGMTCRWADVPVPAPNTLVGALLVLSITLGYLAADLLLRRGARAAGRAPPLRGAPPGRAPSGFTADYFRESKSGWRGWRERALSHAGPYPVLTR